ncbi:hypothetical protein M9Y10_010725 [Tritrichomonas musculus]|uniref:Uncharacterized protein n=1 Tax=Tritrichomonas musculus TaxID=1915356 RepID=A0ABR2IP18_9EUKA
MFSPFSSSPDEKLSFAFEQLAIQPNQVYCGCFNQNPIALGEIIQRPNTPFNDENCSSISYNYVQEGNNAGMCGLYPFMFHNGNADFS